LFFASKGIEIVEDRLGRASIERHILARLIAEQRDREARLLEEASETATLKQPVPVGVPAQEGMSAAESMMAAPGYVSARDEFEQFPRPRFLDEEFARAREHQRAEQEAARRKEAR
jgi:hypothetical protein